MKRLFITCALVCPLISAAAAPAQAEVRTREKTQVKFEGMLGRIVGMFGGKAAREGLVSTNAIKGDRKATTTGDTGQIVDLAEEKVYNLDMKRKTYTVTTFDELRRQMREAQERAERDARKEEGRPAEPQQEQQPSGPEVEFDFDMKETGATKTLAGYDARQIIMTITVREKGKTVEDGGGLVLTADSWFGPEIAALNELAEFEQRYWKAIAPETAGISAEQMAAVLALYPLVGPAMERLSRENVNLAGTLLATTTTFEAVKSGEQMAQESKSGAAAGGGLGGMVARRVMKRDERPRATILTIASETLEVATEVGPADLEIPAGFKPRT